MYGGGACQSIDFRRDGVRSAGFDENCVRAHLLRVLEVVGARLTGDNQNRYGTRQPISSKQPAQRQAIDKREPEFSDDNRR